MTAKLPAVPKPRTVRSALILRGKAPIPRCTRSQEASIKLAFALLCAPALLTGAALAQAAAPAQPQAAAPSQLPPAGEVDDDEVSRFALTALVLEQVAGDASLSKEQQQAAMIRVMQQTGIDPQRFNQIAIASESDAGLQQRIQAAGRKHIEASQQQPQGR